MDCEQAYEWLHKDRLEYSGCRAAAEAMRAEIDRLDMRVSRLELLLRESDAMLAMLSGEPPVLSLRAAIDAAMKESR